MEDLVDDQQLIAICEAPHLRPCQNTRLRKPLDGNIQIREIETKVSTEFVNLLLREK